MPSSFKTAGRTAASAQSACASPLVEHGNSGLRSQLQRSLAPRHIALLTFGGVIGAGLFVGSGASITMAGPAILLSYISAGTIVFAVMWMIGHLATRFTGRQAFTDLVRAAMGNGAGFIVGWLYWYLWVVVLTIEALAGGTILNNWMPAPAWMLSMALMLGLMAVNLMPSRFFGEFEFWFSLVKVLAIVAFIIVATIACFGTELGRARSWQNLSALPGGFMPGGIASIMTGIVSVFFSLTGAELTTIAATEAREDKSKQPKLAAVLVARIIVFYVASIFLIVCMVPWKSIVPGTSPFTTALKSLNLPWAGTAMTLIILTAVLSCLNSALFISSRVLFGLAANSDASPALVHVTPHGVPRRAVLLVGLSASVCLALASLAPRSAFSFLVNSSGCLILFIYAFICLAALKISAYGQGSSTKAKRLHFVALCTLAAIGGLLLAMGLDPVSAPQLYTGMFPLAITVAIVVIRRHKLIERPETVIDPDIKSTGK